MSQCGIVVRLDLYSSRQNGLCSIGHERLENGIGKRLIDLHTSDVEVEIGIR